MTQPHVNFVLGYFRKIQTSGRGEGLRTYFFEKKKKAIDILDFSLYTWKFQEKQISFVEFR